MGGFYVALHPRTRRVLRLSWSPSFAPLPGGPTPKLATSLDLLIQDSTVIRLFAALAKVYPPTRLAKNTKLKLG